MKRILYLLSYHNAVPIALGILFLGAGGALAASPQVQADVYSSQTSVQSVDNSFITSVDLNAYDFAVQVTGVTEDATNYYVAYTLQTIDLVDSVWQPVIKEESLTVSKDSLRGEDLGTYATEQIAQVRDYERQQLVQTQAIELASGTTQKVVATEYTGLVGKFFDPKTDTFPAYQPPAAPAAVALGAVGGISQATTPGAPSTPNPAAAAFGIDTTPPVITLKGDNPVHLAVGTSYHDPGLSITDNVDGAIAAYQIFVNGSALTGSLSGLNTSAPTTYVITFLARDKAGNQATAIRSVIVGNPDGTVTGGSATSTPGAGTSGTSTSTAPSSGAATSTATTTKPDNGPSSTATSSPPVSTASSSPSHATSTPPAASPPAGTGSATSTASSTPAS